MDSGDAPRGSKQVSPPRWVNDDGGLCPTRPCATCGRVIPIRRWPPLLTGAVRRYPYDVLSFVAWCGHLVEVVLIPEGDGTFSEIPILGVAT